MPTDQFDCHDQLLPEIMQTLQRIQSQLKGAANLMGAITPLSKGQTKQKLLSATKQTVSIADTMKELYNKDARKAFNQAPPTGPNPLSPDENPHEGRKN